MTKFHAVKTQKRKVLKQLTSNPVRSGHESLPMSSQLKAGSASAGVSLTKSPAAVDDLAHPPSKVSNNPSQ